MKKQNKSNDEYVPLVDRDNTTPSTKITTTPPPVNMSYNSLNKTIFQFFREKDYLSFESFKEGFNKTISEDYNNIDILCNLNDLIYNYMSNKKITPEQKINLKNMCDGIQLLHKSMQQYSTETDKVFVAMLTGYTVKLLRNFFHD